MPVTTDRVYQYILDHLKAEGYPPTYTQIGHAVGLSSKSSVHNHVQHLVADGRIKLAGPRRLILVESEPANG